MAKVLLIDDGETAEEITAELADGGFGFNLVAAIVQLHGFRLAIHAGPGGRLEIICPDRASR